ncbi:MAG: hypothetical protein ABJJ26_04180 [Algoriphagus sp.]|uniref:hypothetical protein n=1 Tax=Algoriphagus sp. TaxID=1872435 RepID=UPI0032992E9B
MSTVIAGRIVKDTKLRREQVLQGKTLVEDHQTLASTPSAFFCVFLADHRVAFVPETSFPPTLKNFEAAISLFVKREFKKFTDKIYYAAQESGERITRADVYNDHVPPSISLVPLTSKQSIDQFVSRFQTVKKLTVHLVERNQDYDGKSVFERLLEDTEPMDPSSAKYEVRGSKEGLNLNETKEFISETTEGGYERVTLMGSGHDGETITGTNDEFKLKVETPLSSKDSKRVNQLAKLYEHQKEAGNIRVSPRDKNLVAPKLQGLSNDATAQE